MDKLQAMARTLDILSQSAAKAGEYLDQRHGCGFGDRGHETAMKRGDAVCRRVRKATGYTYP